MSMSFNKKILFISIFMVISGFFSFVPATLAGTYTVSTSCVVPSPGPCDGTIQSIDMTNVVNVNSDANNFDDYGYAIVTGPSGATQQHNTTGVSFGHIPTGDVTSWFQFDGVGVYTIYVHAIDSICCDTGAWANFTVTTNDLLSISASPPSVTSGAPTAVQFTVTNAGNPVDQATVTLSGGATGTCTTNAAGQCSQTITAASNITSTASKAGYTDGTATLTVNCVANNGESCPSLPNACGQVGSGTIDCSGNCDAVTPPNSGCPSCTFTASPTSIFPMDSSTLSWDTANVTSGTITNNLNASVINITSTIDSGSISVTPPNTVTYTLQANGSAGSCSRTASLSVFSPSPPQQGLVPCGRLADDPATGEINESRPCDLCAAFYMTKKMINFTLLDLAIPITVLMLVVSGLLYAFSGGNPRRTEQAKTAIKYTLIGFIIIFLAWLFVAIILEAMGYNDALDWNQVNCVLQN